MVTLTDARGILFLTNEYDSTGKVTRQTQADGTTYQFAYTLGAGGKVTQTDVTDPRGHVRRVTFNADGFPLTDTAAYGTPIAQTTMYVRQAGSNLPTSVTDALGRRTDTLYDAKGNPLTVTSLAGTANAVTTTYTYEPTFSQLTTLTNALNQTTTFGYDGQGNLISITDPLSHGTTFTYNGRGQPVTQTSALGHTTTLTYNLSGNAATIADPLGNTTAWVYDAAGRQIRQTVAGSGTAVAYDALNQVTAVTDATGGVTAFTYDANGNLLTVTDARGNTTTYVYDNLDRVIARTDPLGHSESFAYDAAGNLIQYTDRRGQSATFAYDALNRRTGATYADATMMYSPDAASRLTQITDSVGGTITNAFDGLDRLISQTTALGTVAYTYDVLGRRTQMTVPNQPPVTYAYDSASRLTSITKGSSVVQLAYDNANRRTSLTLPNGITTQYAYDAASRLTVLTYKLGTLTLGDLQYGYDAAGNRIQVGGSWARVTVPQPVASGTYNANNHQIAFGPQTLTYDFNGNLVFDGVNTYTWDARNRLTAIAGPVVASFGYDPVGRRNRKTMNGVPTEIVSDGLNPVQEQMGQTTANLLTSLDLDEYFSRVDATNGQFFLADALGSIVALADNDATVTTLYTFEPFGNTSRAGPAPSTSYDFTGRESDETGLKYYRGRYYHPGAHRFVSEDPIGWLGGDVNLYAYVRNNPLAWRDPTGLETGGFGFQLSGAAAGMGGSLSGGVVVDGQGQVGVAVTTGAGGAGSTSIVGGSVIAQGQATNAETIQDLEGPGATAGLSLQTGGAVGQVEFFTGQGYAGGTVGGGIGTPRGPGATFTGEATYTWVWCLLNCKKDSSGSQAGQPPLPRPGPPPLPGRKR